jgi:hypothetical protein
MENFNIIFYSVIVLGGLVFFALAINQFRKAKKAAETWLTTYGVVLDSSVTVHRSRSSKGNTTVSYKPQVNYEYLVKDQKYSTDRIGFGSSAYSIRGKADKVIANYLQGTKVIVHYDPADPSKAVLETKAMGGVNFIILGVILLAMGLIAIFALPT